MADQALCDGVTEELTVLRGLVEVGAKLYGCQGRQQILDTILCEARRLMRAEAGTLYLAQEGRLRFVSVQNDRMDTAEISRHLMGREVPISRESLAGFVVTTGQVMNIPDSALLPHDAPFRVNRELDAKTGYRVTSILAMPLNCPDRHCIGVLELFNRTDHAGNRQGFPAVGSGIMSLASSAAIALHNLGLQERLRSVHLHTIFRLSTVAEFRDADTGEHIERVSRTSQLIAGSLGLDDEQAELIKYASPMHDVGKVAIPDAILLKPGHLTEAQRVIMQRHTTAGACIFGEPEDEVLTMAQQVALSHHERWDGEGYPNAQSGEAIPMVGRIVGLADVFDAVVSHRCYKGACSLDVALDILDKDRGKHFEPVVVDAFLDVLDDVVEGYPTLKGDGLDGALPPRPRSETQGAN